MKITFVFSFLVALAISFFPVASEQAEASYSYGGSRYRTNYYGRESRCCFSSCRRGYTYQYGTYPRTSRTSSSRSRYRYRNRW